jgi:hypothetical protein
LDFLVASFLPVFSAVPFSMRATRDAAFALVLCSFRLCFAFVSCAHRLRIVCALRLFRIRFVCVTCRQESTSVRWVLQGNSELG